jgi:flagellar basal body rod protein FlgG
MNYALQLSASGVLTSMYRQDVLANNLANVDTVGYRPDIPATRQRDPATREDSLFNLPSNRLLERLGAGVLVQPSRTSTAQGPIEKTSNPLDLAIEGSGFFVVSATSGSGGDRLRLTRDGRLAINSDGWLVQSASGQPVLDQAGNRIRIDTNDGPVSIGQDGTIRQPKGTVGTLQFVDVPDAGSLQKVGNGEFRPTAAQASNFTPAAGRIQSQAIERSSVDPITAIMGVTDASQNIANNTKLMQITDELMGRLINSVGRVA